MGLRQFSMHPAQILEVKQEVLGSNLADLKRKAARLLATDDPVKLRQQLERLNAVETMPLKHSQVPVAGTGAN